MYKLILGEQVVASSKDRYKLLNIIKEIMISKGIEPDFLEQKILTRRMTQINCANTNEVYYIFKGEN